MQNRNFPVRACIYNLETKEEFEQQTNNGNIFHAEVSAINNLNAINKHIEENRKYGIVVNLFPCQSCLEYIAKNRISFIKYNHSNNHNHNKKTIHTILTNDIKTLKTHSE